MTFGINKPLTSRLFVTPSEALYSPEFLGLPTPMNPAQAASIAMCRGRFPLPTLLIMGRRMVRVSDILKFAEGAAGAPVPTSPNASPGRKRGRPSKAELAARVTARGEAGHD